MSFLELNLLTNLLTPLITGILASLTPCVLVLFPIVMYRFMKEGSEQINKKEYLLFILGFLSSFLLTGVILLQILNSGIKNSIQFTLGFFLITIGILEIAGKINSLNFKPIKNTFIFGFVFAFAISLSPCAIPFLGSMLGIGFGFNILLQFLLFGVGVLFPSFLFTIVSKNILKPLMKTNKFMYRFSKMMSIVLILTGLFISLKITSLNHFEIYISSGILILIILFIFFSFLQEKRLKHLLNIPRIILFISLLFFVLTFVYNCTNNQTKAEEITNIFSTTSINTNSNIINTEENSKAIELNNNNLEQNTCNTSVMECKTCMRCFYLFLTALILAFIGNLGLTFYDSKK